MMIELKDVVKMYENGRRAINDASLNVEQGENLAIIGTAGSGKTTLMRLIAGIESPSAGSIVVNGQEVHEMDRNKVANFRNLVFGILVRNQNFVANISVKENIALPLTLRKTTEAEKTKAVQEQMELMGIAHKASAYPSQLSILEKHLAGIARALMTQPPILLIDDFGADLPPKDFEQVYGILYAILNFSEVTTIRFTDKENDGLPMNKKLHLESGRLVEVE